MTEFLSQLFGALDDMRALLKAGISRLMTLFVVFVAANILIAQHYQRWMHPGHVILTVLMLWVVWRLVWQGLNRITDAALVTSAAGYQPSTDAIDRVKQIFAIVMLTGLGFAAIPTYLAHWSISVVLVIAIILFVLSSPRKWDWLLINKVAGAFIILTLFGMLFSSQFRYWGPWVSHHFGMSTSSSYYVTSQDTVEKWCFDCKIEDGRLVSGSNFSRLADVKADNWYVPVEPKSPTSIDLDGVNVLPVYKAYDSQHPVKGFDRNPKRIAFVPFDHLKRQTVLAGTNPDTPWYERYRSLINFAWLMIIITTLVVILYRYLKRKQRAEDAGHAAAAGPTVHHAAAPHPVAHAAAHEEHGGHGAGLPPAVWVTLIVVLGIVLLLFTQRWWNNIGTGPVYASNSSSTQPSNPHPPAEQRGGSLPVPGVSVSQHWNPESQKWETPDFTTLSDFCGRWKVVVPANTEVFTDIQVKRAQTITFISRSGQVKNNPQEGYTNPPQGTYPIDIISPATPPYTLPEAYTGALLCRFSGNKQWFDAGGRDGNTYTVEVEEGQIVFATNTRVGERNFATGQFEVVFEIQ